MCLNVRKWRCDICGGTTDITQPLITQCATIPPHLSLLPPSANPIYPLFPLCYPFFPFETTCFCPLVCESVIHLLWSFYLFTELPLPPICYLIPTVHWCSTLIKCVIKPLYCMHFDHRITDLCVLHLPAGILEGLNNWFNTFVCMVVQVETLSSSTHCQYLRQPFVDMQLCLNFIPAASSYTKVQVLDTTWIWRSIISGQWGGQGHCWSRANTVGLIYHCL